MPNYPILMRLYKADKRLAFSLGAKSLVPMNYPILDNSGHLWTFMLKFLPGFCNVTNCVYGALTGVTLKLLSNIVPPRNHYLHRNWMGHLRAGPTKGSLVAWDARKSQHVTNWSGESRRVWNWQCHQQSQVRGQFTSHTEESRPTATQTVIPLIYVFVEETTPSSMSHHTERLNIEKI